MKNTKYYLIALTLFLAYSACNNSSNSNIKKQTVENVVADGTVQEHTIEGAWKIKGKALSDFFYIKKVGDKFIADYQHPSDTLHYIGRNRYYVKKWDAVLDIDLANNEMKVISKGNQYPLGLHTGDIYVYYNKLKQ